MPTHRVDVVPLHRHPGEGEMRNDRAEGGLRRIPTGQFDRMLRVGAIWHAELESYAVRGCNIFAYRNNPAEFALLKSPRRPKYPFPSTCSW